MLLSKYKNAEIDCKMFKEPRPPLISPLHIIPLSNTIPDKGQYCIGRTSILKKFYKYRGYLHFLYYLQKWTKEDNDHFMSCIMKDIESQSTTHIGGRNIHFSVRLILDANDPFVGILLTGMGPKQKLKRNTSSVYDDTYTMVELKQLHLNDEHLKCYIYNKIVDGHWHCFFGKHLSVVPKSYIDVTNHLNIYLDELLEDR